MDWLGANGYQPISEETLFRALYEGGPLPPRPVVLTFDDGYVHDAGVAVAPVLRRRHWPATLASSPAAPARPRSSPGRRS